MANTYDFKFVTDVGTITYICAQSIKEAIQFYYEKRSCDEKYIKEHCKIENFWMVL